MKIPIAETYERQIEYIPYRKSVETVESIVCCQTSNHKHVLDLMCGPGFLLGRIKEKRKDLFLKGVDNDTTYIEYASKRYPQVVFDFANVLEWISDRLYNVVMCTGALHHISHEQQEEMIKKMSRMVTPNGLVIISDCYIDEYPDEEKRKLAAVWLGYEYLVQTIRNGAPDDVIEATIDILRNDVLADGEFKTSLAKRLPIFGRHFREVETIKTWPNNIWYEYGDYITLLRSPKL